jgi:hypothetical protein
VDIFCCDCLTATAVQKRPENAARIGVIFDKQDVHRQLSYNRLETVGQSYRRKKTLGLTALVEDVASVGFYESATKKKFARVQLLTIEGLLDNTQRAEHPDYEPDLNFKKAKAETDAEQQTLI